LSLEPSQSLSLQPSQSLSLEPSQSLSLKPSQSLSLKPMPQSTHNVTSTLVLCGNVNQLVTRFYPSFLATSLNRSKSVDSTKAELHFSKCV
jgi:hypothetical protein